MFPHSLSRAQKIAASIFALLILLIGFGILVRRSLPGNPLYKIKTGVIEKFGALFAVTSESKAIREISLTKRRVDEFLTLFTEKSITPQKRVELANLFIGHIDEARNSILSLKNSDDLIKASHEVASIRGALEGYHEAFLEIRSRKGDAKTELDEFGISMEHEMGRLDNLKDEIIAAIAKKNTPAFGSAAQAGEEEVHEIMNDVRSSLRSQEAQAKLSADERHRIEEHLQAIVSSLDTALKNVGEGKSAEALMLAHQMLSEASREDVLLAIRLVSR